MIGQERRRQSLQQEIRVLVIVLTSFLAVLVLVLLGLVITILRLERLGAKADSVTRAIAPIMETTPPAELARRLEVLRMASGVERIEVYRGDHLVASAGDPMSSAEVFSRPLHRGRMLVFFESSEWAGGRRTALLAAAAATMAAIGGLLIFLLYVPKFIRPVEAMLAEAQRVSGERTIDDDAHYLLQTFRDAVEKIEQQSQEIDHLRDAASTRRPFPDLAQSLHESFTSGFLAADAEGNVVSLNDAGRTILRMTEGQRPAVIRDLPRSFAEILTASMEAQTALTRREVELGEPGTVIGVTTAPLFAEGRFVGLFALFTDLTSLRAMEARVRDLETLVALGQISAGIAHEFRNSLFTILGYLNLAKRTASTDTQTRIEHAETEAKKINAAIDALLSFASPLTVRRQRVDLGVVVAGLVEKTSAGHPDIRFAFASSGKGIEIRGDPDLLGRAIDNILRNAVDAVRQAHPREGGVIEVEIRGDPQPSVSVRDNGVGVDPAEVSTLLLPFQSRKSHGFGLGLPLARKIVLHHGGLMSMTGTPGEGATVVLHFPGAV